MGVDPNRGLNFYREIPFGEGAGIKLENVWDAEEATEYLIEKMDDGGEVAFIPF